MGNLFSAKINIYFCHRIDNNEWFIKAKIVDDTGNFMAVDASADDIIYINDPINNNILRYKVSFVVSASGNDFNANIEWDKINDKSKEPILNSEAIIGTSSDNLKLTNLPSAANNNIGESFITAIKNYENLNILDKAFSSEQNNNKKLYIAAENIKKYQVLYLNNNSEVAIADCYNLDCADKIVGLALEDVDEGYQLSIHIDGKLSSDDWKFVDIGKPIFINQNGEFSAIPDSNGKFVQQLGTIIDKNTILLDMEEAIVL